MREIPEKTRTRITPNTDSFYAVSTLRNKQGPEKILTKFCKYSFAKHITTNQNYDFLLKLFGLIAQDTNPNLKKKTF